MKPQKTKKWAMPGRGRRRSFRWPKTSSSSALSWARHVLHTARRRPASGHQPEQKPRPPADEHQSGDGQGEPDCDAYGHPVLLVPRHRGIAADCDRTPYPAAGRQTGDQPPEAVELVEPFEAAGGAKYCATASAKPPAITCWPVESAAIDASKGSVMKSGSISAPGIWLGW